MPTRKTGAISLLVVLVLGSIVLAFSYYRLHQQYSVTKAPHGTTLRAGGYVVVKLSPDFLLENLRPAEQPVELFYRVPWETHHDGNTVHYNHAWDCLSPVAPVLAFLSDTRSATVHLVSYGSGDYLVIKLNLADGTLDYINHETAVIRDVIRLKNGQFHLRFMPPEELDEKSDRDS